MNDIDLKGKQAVLNCENLSVDVNILDTKTSYGVFRALITPVSGTGQTWVSVARLVIKE